MSVVANPPKDQTTEKQMTDIVVANTDGWAVQESVGASMIVGKMLKFLDGEFIADKTETLPADTTLAAVDVVTAWVHWDDKKPIEHRITHVGQSHPYRDELPDRDETKWPCGLNDEPSDPWRDTRYLRLTDPKTGQVEAVAAFIVTSVPL